MLERYRAWTGALTVLAITVVLVILDLSDESVRGFWSRHSFTSSVLAGLLVLLLTVLIVDRVSRMRQVKNQSRAIAAQAAVIVAQAGRAAEAIASPSPSEEDRDEASQELRTYMQMLLTSAPVLIEARTSRAFLEAAQRAAGQLFRAQRDGAGDGTARTNVGDALDELHRAAAPLLAPLSRDQEAAASSDGGNAESG